MNDGFQFWLLNRLFLRVLPGCMGKSLVITVRSLTELAHVHEQSEFTYGGYLVTAVHL